MRIESEERPLSEFLADVKARRVRVNKSYQRSGNAWPADAKSYLIETIIGKKYLPRLVLSRDDSRRHDELVDGQQRTMALLDFRYGTFKIGDPAERSDLHGRRYLTLETVDRQAFDDFKVGIDRFEDATKDDIREYFRRINYYTAPLNSEEQRHAEFQGVFKWFIQDRRDEFAELFALFGTYTEKQVDRMADAKLLTEVVHAVLDGIVTTNRRILRKLYLENDTAFAEAANVERRLRAAKKRVIEIGPVAAILSRPHQMYSLILAVMHVLSPVPMLLGTCPVDGELKPNATIQRNLRALAQVASAEDEGQVHTALLDFYRASTEGTNVRGARIERVRWYVAALTETTVE